MPSNSQSPPGAAASTGRSRWKKRDKKSKSRRRDESPSAVYDGCKKVKVEQQCSSDEGDRQRRTRDCHMIDSQRHFPMIPEQNIKREFSESPERELGGDRVRNIGNHRTDGHRGDVGRNSRPEQRTNDRHDRNYDRQFDRASESRLDSRPPPDRGDDTNCGRNYSNNRGRYFGPNANNSREGNGGNWNNDNNGPPPRRNNQDNRPNSEQRSGRRPPNNDSGAGGSMEWGKPPEQSSQGTGANAAVPKEKPSFELSGKLAEDTNKFNGVVVSYNEPKEAKKPVTRWRMYPFKGDEALPVYYVHRQSAYLIGRERRVADIPVDHPSCSKQHAVLQYRLVPVTRADGSLIRKVKPYVIDLGSANGTFLNNDKIEPKRYYEVMEKDMLKFGFSSREYVLLHEHSKDEEEEPELEGGTGEIADT